MSLRGIMRVISPLLILSLFITSNNSFGDRATKQQSTKNELNTLMEPGSLSPQEALQKAQNIR